MFLTNLPGGIGDDVAFDIRETDGISVIDELAQPRAPWPRRAA
jgi:hypothetical protein